MSSPKKVRKVVIPAAGSHLNLLVPKAYSFASRCRLNGTIPAYFSQSWFGGLNV